MPLRGLPGGNWVNVHLNLSQVAPIGPFWTLSLAAEGPVIFLGRTRYPPGGRLRKLLTHSLTWKLETEAWQRGETYAPNQSQSHSEAVKAFLGPLFWLPLRLTRQ